MRPNLFDFATSELSQDAILCWLLSWADSKGQSYDSTLFNVATELLSALYQRAGVTLPVNFESIEIRKQEGGIDIMCIINNDTAIIIEDKIGTKQHSNQLARYKDHVFRLGFPADKVIAAYLQTGDQGDYQEVEKHGYVIFERHDLLKILESLNGHGSDILSDFTRYLRKIDNDVKSFKDLLPTEWSWNCWKGFYTALQRELGDGNWDYVPNPNGGFLGYWWHSVGNDECEQYLQLEQDKFCFKIWVSDPEKRSTLRDKWYERIIKECPNHGIKAKRPDRFGNGEYMTVAILDQEYRVLNGNGKLDIPQIIKIIKSAESVLDTLAA
jgi:hypothetical protein